MGVRDLSILKMGIIGLCMALVMGNFIGVICCLIKHHYKSKLRKMFYVHATCILLADSSCYYMKASQMRLVKPVDLFQKLLKRGPLEKGRLLGLDVGNKYVGLAVSDPENKIASPHSVLVRKKSNTELMAIDFQTLVSRFSLVGFVVGYPFSLQGQSSIEAIQVKLFIEDLRNTGKLDGMNYAYWDENYTSKCVEALLEPLNLHPVEYKTILDKFAAVGILQGYLDDMQRKVKSGNILDEQ